MITKIEQQAFTAKLLKNNIFHIKYHDNTVSTLEELTAGYEAYLELCDGKPYKVLIEVGKSAYFDIEANECLKDGKILPEAEAIVTDSLAIRLALDYYKYSRKNNHLLRIFQNNENALHWLNSLE